MIICLTTSHSRTVGIPFHPVPGVCRLQSRPYSPRGIYKHPKIESPAVVGMQMAWVICTSYYIAGGLFWQQPYKRSRVPAFGTTCPFIPTLSCLFFSLTWSRSLKRKRGLYLGCPAVQYTPAERYREALVTLFCRDGTS